jgi:N-carbamoylputrescine amidase
MRVGFVQWPDGLMPRTDTWSNLAAEVARSAPDVLITNEMPFGPWLAASPNYNPEQAQESVQIHDEGLEALRALHLPLVISSRPIIAGGRLVNEAFVLERGTLRFLHQKHFFPAEQGWFETEWFGTSEPGFETIEAGGLHIGALICTELMFNERARAYGRAGAHLIAVPRAAGESLAEWKTAGAMAAIVSGCYVVSSNRVGSNSGGPIFGGGGYAFAPDGSLLCASSDGVSIAVFDLDPRRAEEQKSRYPIYVAEQFTPTIGQTGSVGDGEQPDSHSER